MASQAAETSQKSSLIELAAEKAAAQMSWNSLIEQMANPSLPEMWRMGILRYTTQAIEDEGIEQSILNRPVSEHDQKKLNKEHIPAFEQHTIVRAALLDAVVDLAVTGNHTRNESVFTRALHQIFLKDQRLTDTLPPDEGVTNRFLVATRAFGWKKETKKQAGIPTQTKANSILRLMDGQDGASLITDLVQLEALKRISKLSFPEFEKEIPYPNNVNRMEALLWHDTAANKKAQLHPTSVARIYGSVLEDEQPAILESLTHTGSHATEAIIGMNTYMSRFVYWENRYRGEKEYTFTDDEFTLTESVMNVWGLTLHALGPLHTDTVSGCAGLWWSAHSRFEGNVLPRPATIFGLLSITDEQQTPLFTERVRQDFDTARTALAYVTNARWVEWWADFFHQSKDAPVSEAHQEMLSTMALQLAEEEQFEMTDITSMMQNIFAISPDAILLMITQSERIRGERSPEREDLMKSLLPIADTDWWMGYTMYKDAPNDALLALYAATLELRVNPLTLWDLNLDEISYTATGALHSFIEQHSAQ